MTPSLLIATTVHDTIDAFLVPYAQHFRSIGWRVDAMAAGASTCPTCCSSVDAAHDADWARTPLAFGNRRAIGQVRRLNDVHNYDLVHVHTPMASFLTRLALRPRSASRVAPAQQQPRIVYTAHGFEFDEARPWRSLPIEAAERLAGKWTDHLVVINDEDHAWASRVGAVAPDALELMPGIGLDLHHYALTAQLARRARDVRRELSIPDDALAFTMVAEFIPRKRHVDALEALRHLGRADAHLILVGHGPLQEQVRRRARQLGLGGRCHLVGHKQDVRPWMLAADALLLPSTREGLPRCILEAMSLGVPVIGTDICGTRALLEDDRGMLVPTADPAGIAEAMRLVAEAPQEAVRRADRARAHVVSYDIDELLVRHERTYERLLTGARQGRSTAVRP